MRFIESIKPGVQKRSLLFVAAFVWTFAGGMLLYKGFAYTIGHDSIGLKMIAGFVGGIIFYLILFSNISKKHTIRIMELESDKPCVFSFFSFRSYFLMTIMISVGIFLRKSGLVPIEYLSVFYLAMGTPLFLSALRFYYFGIKYPYATKQK